MCTYEEFRYQLNGLKILNPTELYRTYSATVVGDPSWTELEDLSCSDTRVRERMRWVLDYRGVSWETYNPPEGRPRGTQLVCPIPGCQPRGAGKCGNVLKHVQTIRHCILLSKSLRVPVTAFLNTATCELCGEILFIQRDDSLARHRSLCLARSYPDLGAKPCGTTIKGRRSLRVQPYSYHHFNRQPLRKTSDPLPPHDTSPSSEGSDLLANDWPSKTQPTYSQNYFTNAPDPSAALSFRAPNGHSNLDATLEFYSQPHETNTAPKAR